MRGSFGFIYYSALVLGNRSSQYSIRIGAFSRAESMHLRSLCSLQPHCKCNDVFCTHCLAKYYQKARILRLDTRWNLEYCHIWWNSDPASVQKTIFGKQRAYDQTIGIFWKLLEINFTWFDLHYLDNCNNVKQWFLICHSAGYISLIYIQQI